MSCPEKRDLFWSKITKRRNQIIDGLESYKEMIDDDISELPGPSEVDIDSIFN